MVWWNIHHIEKYKKLENIAETKEDFISAILTKVITTYTIRKLIIFIGAFKYDTRIFPNGSF